MAFSKHLVGRGRETGEPVGADGATQNLTIVTAQPVMLLVQTSGGVVLAVILPAPLPEAATLSVRELLNRSTMVRFAVMSTRQTEPLRREHPVQPAKLLSTPVTGVRATVVP